MAEPINDANGRRAIRSSRTATGVPLAWDRRSPVPLLPIDRGMRAERFLGSTETKGEGAPTYQSSRACIRW